VTRVVLLIRSLGVGGAERQLVVLARALHARGVDVRVLTFYPAGPLRPELEAAGVPVEDLGKGGRWDVLPFLWRLWRRLRALRPDVLYSWLPMANVLAAIVGPMAGVPRIVWGVRASNLDADRYDWLHRVEQSLARRLARRADAIICNAEAGRYWHEALGYPRERMVVIENGIDTERFHFDARARARLRKEWGIADHEHLIGLVARIDPMKDHDTFLRAAALLAQRRPDVRFVCVGDGPESELARLQGLAHALGLDGRLLWLGRRADVAQVLSAMDIASSSSSYGEGFSNAIGEAMACSRICVVTDVGDSRRIVGETGFVVPPRDPEALARGWETALAFPPEQRTERERVARRRVEERFSVRRMVERTEQVLFGENECEPCL
jgi:glycosyltransferase involved in cell wall biosynthesis